MKRFGDQSEKPIWETDHTKDKEVGRIRRLQKEEQEKAVDLEGILSKKSEAFEGVMNDNFVLSQVAEDDREEIEKIRKTWGVEVAGKIRAYANSGNRKYRRDLTKTFLRAREILLPAVVELFRKKVLEYGFSEEDVNSSEDLQDFIQLFPSSILEGLLTMEDAEKELARITEELTNPNK